MRSRWDPPVDLGYTDLAFDPRDLVGRPCVGARAPGLPLILKGILTGEDARLAEAGVNALVVSNHGGRRLGHSTAACVTAATCSSRSRSARRP
jgi:hypothetical protein